MLVRERPVGAVYRAPSLLRGSGLLLLASLATTATNYGFQIVLGRSMGPDEFGRWSAAFSLVALTGMVGVALQTAVARTEATRPVAALPVRPFTQVVRDPVLARVLCASCALATMILVTGPVLAQWLGLDAAVVAGIALLMPGTALCSVAFGLLQGSRRFGALALMNAVLAIGKFAAGAAALAIGLGSAPILLALGTLAVVTALVAIHWGARRPLDDPRLLLQDTGRAAVALGAVALVAVIDVPLARYWLDPTAAGRYAAAATAARSVLFVPAVIASVALPELARRGRGSDRRERGVLVRAAILTVVGALLGCGALAVFAPIVLPPLLGPTYDASSPLVWQLGLASVPFAAAGLLVQFLLARSGAWWLVLLPLAPAAQVAWLIFVNDQPTDVMWSCVVASTVLLVVSAFATVRECRRP